MTNMVIDSPTSSPSEGVRIPARFGRLIESKTSDEVKLVNISDKNLELKPI